MSLVAQNIEIQQKFTWLLPDNIHNSSSTPFYFEELSGWSDETKLPVHSLRIPLKNLTHIDSINISYTTQSSLISQFQEINFLTSVPFKQIQIIKKHIVTINKKYYLELEITPIEYSVKNKTFSKIEHIKLSVQVAHEVKQSTFKSSKASANSSILSQGKWIKIKIMETGVHKIPYTLLSSWGFSDPSKVNLFGNGGNMLPKACNASRLDDLTENAILHTNEAIFFYAQGSTAWTFNSSTNMFEHQLHDYSDETYYFLSDNNGIGKRIEPSTNTSTTYTHETDQYDSYQFHEFNNQNLLKSGIEWYGLRFDPNQERQYSFEFKNLNTDEPVKILTSVIGRSNMESSFNTYINNSNEAIQVINIPSVQYTYTGYFARQGIGSTQFYTNQQLIDVKLQYNSNKSASSGWLNSLCLNAIEKLIFVDHLSFRNIATVGNENNTRFYIQGTKEASLLWDITNHTSPSSINIETYQSKHGFTYQTDELREFILFNTDATLPQPEFESSVQNQNLRNTTVPDMLIITHPLFKDEAERLAEIHLNTSGLICLVVEPQQIYNEFSAGSPDVSAIRDFARHLYLKSDKFKYLLLFGDGSYDNKTYDDKNTNFILTYQSENSLNVSKTYTSDDFFGCLDDNEGENILNNRIDIGIGRLPVSTVEHARTVVDKIDNYLNNSNAGTWKTDITIVADDNQESENNIHIRDAEALSNLIYKDHPNFNHHKIYLDAYPKVITSTGGRYPEVNQAIKEKLENGTLIFNYTGHGNEKTLAHEQILTIDEIKQLTNKDRLPIFVTATCEFSRYDEYQLITAGEWVLLSPNGGGVGLFTTTRIAWSSHNSEINKNFYKYIFNKNDNGEKTRLGDVIRLTKNNTSNSVNKLNFTLLGDPALTLQFPNNTIQTTHINGEEDITLRDTLNARSIAEIKGEVETSSPTSNNQTLHIKVFDKPTTVKTRGNGGYTPFEYSLYENRIFEGTLDVNNNHFLSSFMVPNDIRLNIDYGRISYYAYDDEGNEAFGADNSVLIGGISDNHSNDNHGPNIKLWLNDPSFQDGDNTGSQPILYAQIEDESGINISGVGIGHDITLVIDNNRSLPINLNNYFNSDKNSFTTGSLYYQLSQLETGEHMLELKAWDNLNNSSVSSLKFQVHQDGTLNISNANIYPNPIEPGSTVKIYFEHDAPNLILDITCKIYSISGRLVDQFQKTHPAIGTTISPIEWTPGALQKGMYIFHGEIRSSENQIGKFSKKILVIK